MSDHHGAYHNKIKRERAARLGVRPSRSVTEQIPSYSRNNARFFLQPLLLESRLTKKIYIYYITLLYMTSISYQTKLSAPQTKYMYFCLNRSMGTPPNTNTTNFSGSIGIFYSPCHFLFSALPIAPALVVMNTDVLGAS